MDPNWRPVQGSNPSDGGDWRAQLSPEARGRIVNKIIETLKKHLPMSEVEEQNEVPRIALLFEEKIYCVATNQADYLRKLSMKMLSMETEGQQAPGNAQVIPDRNNPGQGSKRKTSENASAANEGVHIDVSASSSTPSVIGSSGTPAQGQDHPAPGTIEIDDDDETGTQVSGKRQKRCTSMVWKYFTKKKVTVEMEGKKYEQLWGHCNFPNCKVKYRAESINGTTGFITHLRTAHSIVKGQQQLKVEKDHGKDITVVEPYRYDQEVSVKKLYLAIIMHEYPFQMVEHDYFVDFIKSLRPNFPLKSRVTARKEIMDMYLEEKEKLYAHLKTVQCRFSATMDMWTSRQNKAYMCVTLHWIDDDWRIQKRIVGFFNVEGRHTGRKLAETFSEVMVKWYVEKKLFASTLDNASANDVAVNDIIADLRDVHASLVCDGIFFHVRCACHILNLVARDGMSVISGTIEKIKALVLAVKESPLQWEELMKRAAESDLIATRGIQIDVSTRWNSTYLMLTDALYYEPAFVRLKSSDRRRYEKISPSPEEWDMARTIHQCLEIFYDLTALLSGTSYPTANLFYRGFCDIKVMLDKWKVCDDLTIRTMAIAMSAKFEKYWKKSNIALAVACFLDPRYKRKIIEFYMRRFYGNLYQVHLEEFVSVMRQLYQFYASSAPASSSKNAPRDMFMGSKNDELESFLYDDVGSDGDGYNELDKYMAEPLLKQSQFDILAWWKNKTEVYHILSRVARDVMAIQVSTVASESAFSTGGRVIDPYRSRLDPEMVQALICTKDWIAASRKDSKHVPSITSDLEILDEISPIEDCEEVESDPDVMRDEL